MANFTEKSGWCPGCNRQVLARKAEPSHVFWLIATLFSCGFFIIFWFFDIIAKSSKPFLCSQCGNAVGSKPTTLAQPTLSPAMQQIAMRTNQFSPVYQSASSQNYQSDNNTASSKCSNCGLVNFASDSICKRCKTSLR